MKIHRIELENYRQYRGKHVIELSTDDSYNLNIILGANGTGKTNLLNAINWCLYGDEPSLQKTRKELQQCIANEKELAEEGRVVVRICIWIGDKNPEYFFERTVCITGSPTKPNEEVKTWRAAYLSEGNWIPFGGQDWRDMTQFNIIRDSILPEGIRNFFFFDGERLDDFFRKGMEHEVKNAIIKVCQIELLDRCIEHLSSKSTELRRSIKGESPKIEEINNEIDILTQSKENLEKEIKELDKKISEATKNKENIEDKLRECTQFNARDLQRERDYLESEINNLDKKIKEKEKEIKDYFASNIYFVLGFDALKKTHEIINKRIKGLEQPPIPPDIKEPFLRGLLSRHKCICGTELIEGSKEREAIEKLMKDVEFSSRISDDVNEGYYKIDNIIKKCKSYKTDRYKLEKDHRELCEERERKDQRLKEISEKLKGIPIEEIQNLENLRNTFEDEIRKCIAERSQKELQLQGVEERLKLKIKELQKEIRKDERQKKLRLKLELCDKSIEILKEIKENVATEIRTKVEQKTKEYFFNLHWKGEEFGDVKINENYEIELVGQYGAPKLGTLSAGERQILALSFMAALSGVSGFDAPVIIDTPLGRISGEPKEKISMSLPRYLKDSQLTLLITDQEYTPVVRNHMKERIGKELELRYDENEMRTDVVELGEE